MPIFSNVEQVNAFIQDVVKGVNFDMPGPVSTLGHDMSVAATEGIQERSWEEQAGASGEEWPENSPSWKAYKATHYDIHDKTNYCTTQMLSAKSVLGEQSTEDDGKTFVWRYGTGQPPDRSLTGHLEERDLAVTDREKAEIAHADGRQFFELDQMIDSKHIMPILKDALQAHLQEKMNS